MKRENASKSPSASGRRAFFIQPELATNTGSSTSRTALAPCNICPPGRSPATSNRGKKLSRSRLAHRQRDHEHATQEKNGRHRREDEGLLPRRLCRRFFLAEPRALARRDDLHPEQPRGVAGAALRPRRISRGVLPRR